jgi:nucleoside-diphosphate-sugar epimerase
MRILVAGALGEVGRAVAASLLTHGWAVIPVSGRAPHADHPGILDLPEAVDAIASRSVDGVLVASGRGDRRPGPRTGQEATEVLGNAACEAGLRSVLVSTTRVLEGTPGAAGDAPSSPATPYAQANADNESTWLDAGGMSVLRITNFFCVPSSSTSPQHQLLPWSLAHEALQDGTISVRSAPGATKEFVDADDVASAIAILISTEHPPRVCATTPGAVFSMRDLVSVVSRGLVRAGHEAPEATFGDLTSPDAALPPGWLASQGWRTRLTDELMADAVAGWLASR